ncbi:unnamed protein product [Arabidopsis arenosa]|uniref:F-box associated beta-propeller type 1 domain-containing protein n=1 Tax=Arabidopsis arenosa TaxID=38785 RepID=A0A8S2AM23_ARAAE|nr:unnamed protein product [Arabidopsis arenosa]
MERLGFWGLLMGSVEKSSDSGNSVACSASANNGDEDSSTSSKQVSPLKGSGSRNTSPLGRVGSRNTSPSRQKVVKTKPRGLEEETVASFGKPVVADVQMEDGGLVCFSGMDGLTFRTLVCNPLMQSWRTLPSMHYNQQRQLIMVVDRSDKSFKVIATSDIYGDKSVPTEVYDSKTDKWSLHQIMPAVNLCSSKMAYCDSRLYLETLSPLGLMMYRLDTGQWEHIPAKFPRSLLDGYLVAGTQKRLFLVGRIGLYSTLQSMRIWELDHAKVSWVEISRMPPKYFRALLRLSAERFECFGQDNLICFTSWNQGKGLLYNVDKKIWSWISGCALQSCNSQVCFYEPRFDASVH